VKNEKGVFVHAMKAYRGSRGIAPLILNFGAGWTFLEKRKISCPCLDWNPGLSSL
jgi:hypothetical protein